jgi:hypothetical protein
VLGVLGYTGWLTAKNFFFGSDPFRRLFPARFLDDRYSSCSSASSLFQGLIRLSAGKERLVERVFSRRSAKRLERAAKSVRKPDMAAGEQDSGIGKFCN